MLGKIWERYLSRQLMGVAILFLFCFYGLYVLIDYASNSSSFGKAGNRLNWQEISLYYFFVFSNRSEILIPLALLIASVHTLCSLNARHELVAFMASGFALKSLMKPFIMIGLLCSLLMYANEQFFLPGALRKLRRIENLTKQSKEKNSLPLSAHHLLLQDRSILIYQDFETLKDRFFDVYWIESIDSIYRIKYLYPSLDPETEFPKGQYVDHLKRQNNGDFIRVAVYPEYSFSTMKFDPQILQSAMIDPEILSLTALIQEMKIIESNPDAKENKVLTAFYWKLAMPWLCLLAIIAPISSCVKFSRRSPVFLIYVCSLFGLIAFYMFMDAAQVVAKRELFPPFWAILGPFFALFAYFGWRFFNLKSS